MTVRKALAGGFQIALGLAYPFLVWTGLSRFEPRQVGLFVLAFFVLRFARKRPDHAREAARSLWRPALAIGLLVAAVVVWNDPFGLLMMPVAISLLFLLTFAVSLRTPQPMIERFARLQVGTLSDAEVAYCRRVTWVWCAFFVVNASIAAGLALAGPIEAWALYTGFIAYLLMGTLFATEYVYRHARFRRYEGGVADPILKRFFPPETKGGDVVLQPLLESRGEEGRTLRIRWKVPEDLDCWPGHFPEQSLLPGVLQLEWILRALESERETRVDLRRIERLKFKRPVLPGDSLELEMTETTSESKDDGGDERFRFQLRVGDEVVTTGTLLMRAAPDGATETDPTDTPVAASENPATAAPDARPRRVRSEWPSPDALLPHRPPMLWLDSVLHHEEGETQCLVSTDDLAGFVDTTGRAGGWVAIEWMAQCVAAHDGTERHRSGLPIRPGMLLGAQRLELEAGDFARGESYRVTARPVFGHDSDRVLYDCSVAEAGTGRLRAAARLSCLIGTPGAPLV